MTEYVSMQNDFNYIVNKYGEILRIKYYVSSGGTADYDDNVVFTASGTAVWTSGIIFPLGNSRKGSSEFVLMEQGKITYDDSQLYLKGSINLSGSAIKIGVGSPIEEEWQILQIGIDEHKINNVAVYKKAYIRLLPTGSFIGE